jgi:regulator of nucleoside diphosphate kinase
MALELKARPKPAITLTRSEHAALERLAQSVVDRNPDAADGLLAELDRARIVEDGKLGGDVVRMDAEVRYGDETGESRTVTLVHPSKADISAGRISVLTPIGTALIGLKAGQSIDWHARDGRRHRLTVEAVRAPDGPAAP